MAITYLIRNKTLPGMPARNPDPRTTDDKFIIEVRTGDNHGHSAEAITDLLRSTPVFEINERQYCTCLLYTSPSPRDRTRYRMPSSA